MITFEVGTKKHDDRKLVRGIFNEGILPLKGADEAGWVPLGTLEQHLAPLRMTNDRSKACLAKGTVTIPK